MNFYRRRLHKKMVDNPNNSSIRQLSNEVLDEWRVEWVEMDEWEWEERYGKDEWEARYGKKWDVMLTKDGEEWYAGEEELYDKEWESYAKEWYDEWSDKSWCDIKWAEWYIKKEQERYAKKCDKKLYGLEEKWHAKNWEERYRKACGWFQINKLTSYII